jgi:hypothetical protein
MRGVRNPLVLSLVFIVLAVWTVVVVGVVVLCAAVRRTDREIAGEPAAPRVAAVPTRAFSRVVTH